MADHRRVFQHSAPDLDVEVLVGRFAVGCKDVVTEPREVIDVPIKGLEVKVAPGAAHTFIVSRVARLYRQRRSQWLDDCHFLWFSYWYRKIVLSLLDIIIVIKICLLVLILGFNFVLHKGDH